MHFSIPIQNFEMEPQDRGVLAVYTLLIAAVSLLSTKAESPVNQRKMVHTTRTLWKKAKWMSHMRGNYCLHRLPWWDSHMTGRVYLQLDILQLELESWFSHHSSPIDTNRLRLNMLLSLRLWSLMQSTLCFKNQWYLDFNANHETSLLQDFHMIYTGISLI